LDLILKALIGNHSAFQKLIRYLLQLALCIILSILTGSLIVVCTGENPVTVYRLLFRESFLKRRGFMIAILRATPLIMSAGAA